MIPAALALLTASFAAETGASTPSDDLVWSPEAAHVHRYQVRSDTTFSAVGADQFDRAATLSAFPVRPQLPANHLDLRATLLCSFDDVDSPRIASTCAIEDPTLDSRVDHQQGAAAFLGDLEHRLDGAHIVMTKTPRGKLRSVDVRLAGPGEGPWDDLATELVVRAMAGFDLPLPQGDQDLWRQTRSSFQATPSASGPLGRADLTHSRRAPLGDQVVIVSEGALSHLVLDMANRPEAVGDAAVSSVAAFDPRRGVLTARQWTVRDLGQSPYAQVGQLELIDIESPPLAANP